MPISFSDIPANWRQPLYWVEVDGSMAGYPVSHMRSLLVGTMMVSTKKVGTAVVAAGGTGYVVGNTINLSNGVVLTVATVTTGAVATVTITNAGSVYSGAVPTNPVAQVSSNGPGTGASFTLTWIDDVVVPNAGTAVPDVAIIVGRQMDADHMFGAGSQLACQVRAFLKNNWANELWCLPVAPSAGSVAASGTITVSTAPTDAGTISLYIAGYPVRVNIGATFTVNQVAMAIHDAIMDTDMQAQLPVTADSPVAAIVTLHAKWGGVTGNDITMLHSYYGRIGGEELPPGLSLTFSNPVVGVPNMGMLSGGVGFPSFTNAIANLGETEFEFVNLPNLDSTSLLAWEQEWDFSDSGRWGWMRQLYGHLFAAKRDTYSNLVTWGLSRNGKILSVLAVEPSMPSPTYEISAAYTAKAARALINDPARPLQTLHLESMLPAPFHERWNLMELNAFSTSGLATQRTLSDNIPMIARETTTYQLNLYGYGDDAFELVTTLATLARLIRNQRHAITTKFPRHKLADDGTRFGAGQAIVTPKIIKAELVAEYRIDEFNGLVENAQAFKEHLIVERDPNNPNRVNVLYPPDLVNQLRIFAVLNQFRLQYDRGVDEAIIRSGAILGTAAGIG
jgi:phage tail sheath gpL-like